MATYGLRLRFNLPSDSSIEVKSTELELLRLADGRPLTLHALSADSIAECAKLSVRAGGFASEEEARAYAQRVRNALLICGATTQIGIDVGQDKATSRVGKALRARWRKEGKRLLDDVHGTSVFPEDRPVRFISARARVVRGYGAEKFVGQFRRAFEAAPELSSRQALALELYAASRFESSQKARFVTLVSAIEALAQQEYEDREILDHVEFLIKATKEKLAPPARDQLLSRLGQLKRWSISRACKEMVSEHLGPEEAEAFAYAYDVRSQILHEGHVPDDTNLGRECRKLDQLASQLLVSICGA